MTALDTIARSAAAAIDEAVADVAVPATPTPTPWFSWSTVGYAMAGAAAAVVVLLGLVVLATPDDVADTATTTIAPTTTVDATPTTVAPDDPVVPPPVEPTPDTVPPTTVPPGDEQPIPAPDTTPPSLVVTTPADGDRVDAATLVFEGTTEPGASVVAGGRYDVDVAADGSWQIALVLGPGPNGVRFSATDDAGNRTEVTMTVHLDADQPSATTTTKPTTTTTKPTEDWEFTAWQTYGSCAEPLPYDVFSGTAKPGSKVTVTSPHGSGSTFADGEGAWSLRVDFPSAPYNVTFDVKVKDEFGTTKVFPFVSLYEG